MAKQGKKFLTGVARIQFAIQFARMDLERLREGDRLNLKEDFMEFLSPRGEYTLAETGGVFALPMTAPLPNEYSNADFKAIQKEVRKILDQAAAGSAGNIAIVSKGGSPLRTDWVELPTVKFMIHRAPPSGGGATFLMIGGRTHDVFLAVVFFLLQAHGLEKIQMCPQCRNVFSQASRRQLYCSRPCANLASVKAFQSRAKAAAKRKKIIRSKGGK